MFHLNEAFSVKHLQEWVVENYFTKIHSGLLERSYSNRNLQHKRS